MHWPAEKINIPAMPIFGHPHSQSAGHSFTRPAGFPYYTLSCIETGRMLVRVGDDEVEQKPPYAILVKPETHYTVKVLKGTRLCEMYVIFSPRPGWSTWLDWPQILPGVGLLQIAPQFDHLFVESLQDAIAALRTTSPVREAFAYNALERALLLAHERNPQATHAQLDRRVQNAVDYMTMQVGRPIDVQSLADEAHMSPSRFAHLFREQVGETPMKYLEQLRMARAQQMLISTAEPIAQIAQQVGYENPYHFSTRFSKVVGQSPRDYRKRPARR